MNEGGLMRRPASPVTDATFTTTTAATSRLMEPFVQRTPPRIVTFAGTQPNRVVKSIFASPLGVRPHLKVSEMRPACASQPATTTYMAVKPSTASFEPSMIPNVTTPCASPAKVELSSTADLAPTYLSTPSPLQATQARMEPSSLYDAQWATFATASDIVDDVSPTQLIRHTPRIVTPEDPITLKFPRSSASNVRLSTTPLHARGKVSTAEKLRAPRVQPLRSASRAACRKVLPSPGSLSCVHPNVYSPNSYALVLAATSSIQETSCTPKHKSTPTKRRLSPGAAPQVPIADAALKKPFKPIVARQVTHGEPEAVPARCQDQKTDVASRASDADHEKQDNFQPGIIKQEKTAKLTSQVIPKSKTITMFVKFDDEDMAFKVKRSAYLQKIFDNFAQVKGVPVETLRFFFDGTRLKGDVTVESLGLETDSRIDCFSEQVGGSVASSKWCSALSSEHHRAHVWV